MKAGMLNSLIAMLLPTGAAKGAKTSAPAEGAGDFATLLQGAAAEGQGSAAPSARVAIAGDAPVETILNRQPASVIQSPEPSATLQPEHSAEQAERAANEALTARSAPTLAPARIASAEAETEPSVRLEPNPVLAGIVVSDAVVTDPPPLRGSAPVPPAADQDARSELVVASSSPATASPELGATSAELPLPAKAAAPQLVVTADTSSADRTSPAEANAEPPLSWPPPPGPTAREPVADTPLPLPPLKDAEVDAVSARPTPDAADLPVEDRDAPVAEATPEAAPPPPMQPVVVAMPLPPVETPPPTTKADPGPAEVRSATAAAPGLRTPTPVQRRRAAPQPLGQAEAANMADAAAPKAGARGRTNAAPAPVPDAEGPVQAEAVAMPAPPAAMRPKATSSKAEPRVAATSPAKPAATRPTAMPMQAEQIRPRSAAAAAPTTPPPAMGDVAMPVDAATPPSAPVPPARSDRPDAPALGEATALLRLAAREPAQAEPKPVVLPHRAPPLDVQPVDRLSTRTIHDAIPTAGLARTEPSRSARLRDSGAAPVDPASSANSLGAVLTTTPATVAPAAVPTDLAATLGQQVIDMSSSGQWIDGMAREIASLAAGEGRGSFRLSPEHLGPMRVDILPGDGGNEVRLTVETHAAEAALIKDRGQLKADAQLAAVRIGEVTVERVASVADSAPSSNQGHGSQQNQGQQNQGQPTLAQGQQQQGANHNQSQQPRKTPGADAVILNEAAPEQDGQTLRRARYA